MNFTKDITSLEESPSCGGRNDVKLPLDYKGAKKWQQKIRDFKISDLVILCNEDSPQFPQYPYSVIKETIKGSDGHVHSVTMRMSDGKEKKKRHNENCVGGHRSLKTVYWKILILC